MSRLLVIEACLKRNCIRLITSRSPSAPVSPLSTLGASRTLISGSGCDNSTSVASPKTKTVDPEIAGYTLPPVGSVLVAG